MSTEVVEQYRDAMARAIDDTWARRHPGTRLHVDTRDLLADAALRAAVSHVPTQTCETCRGMGMVDRPEVIEGYPSRVACPAGCSDGRVPSGEKLMWGANTDACIVHGVDESAEPDQWVQWLDVRERERTVVLGFKVERLYRALKPSAEETT